MRTERDALPGTAPWRGASSGPGAAAGARAREGGLRAAEPPLPFRSGPGFMQRWREMKAEERGVFSPCPERTWKQPASVGEGQSLIPEAERTPSAPLLLQPPRQCQRRGMFCHRSFLVLSGPLRRPQRSFEALAGLGGWQSPGRRERSPAARHSTARHGTARHGTARHGSARHGTARHGCPLPAGRQEHGDSGMLNEGPRGLCPGSSCRAGTEPGRGRWLRAGQSRLREETHTHCSYLAPSLPPRPERLFSTA